MSWNLTGKDSKNAELEQVGSDGNWGDKCNIKLVKQ
jgi:hypothetical protein